MFQTSLPKSQSNIMSFPLTIWCHQSIYKKVEKCHYSHADRG